MGQSTKTRANCSKMAEPNGSESSSDEGPKRTSSPLKDKIGQYGYGDGDSAILSQTQSSSSSDITRPVDMSKYKVIEDDFMEEQGCKDFELKEDIALLNAAILAEAAVARAESLKNKVKHVHSQLAAESLYSNKRKQKNEAQLEQLENQSISSLQDQFQAESNREAKFNTIDDMKVAQDIRATFEEIMKVDAEKADMLNYHLNPIQKENIFEEISWSGTNVIFPVPKVEPSLPEEKRGLARNVLESAVAVNQGVASMIEDIARNNTNKLVGMIFKVWEALLVSVGDAQTKRECRLKGIYKGAQTEDVLSQSSKERFKRSNSRKRVIMQNQNKGRGRFNRFNSGIFRGKQDGQRVIDFKGRG
ncbi:MAG: hypothetical protein EZS28_012737, partial [Streblomastix strix]